MSIHPGFDQNKIADNPGFIKFLGLLRHHGANPLAADFNYFSCFSLRVNNSLTFVQPMDHWFFEVNMLACIHSFDGDPVVPVVGGGDDDRIDGRIVEDLFVEEADLQQQVGTPVPRNRHEGTNPNDVHDARSAAGRSGRGR